MKSQEQIEFQNTESMNNEIIFIEEIANQERSKFKTETEEKKFKRFRIGEWTWNPHSESITNPHQMRTTQKHIATHIS